ncbi:MAG TPA: phenylalanine--tRNA ligase subunit alpha [Candidatus Methanofastidiosa archaeon]|nr:phenylalanine--tRNA ligase subunit alpha [Candidatus Methanofastidiosa archaeon]
MDLTNDEKKLVLKLLNVDGKATVNEISDADFNQVAVNRAAMGLSSKGLLDIEDSSEKYLVPTGPGKDLIESVPERVVARKVLDAGSTEAYVDEMDIDKATAGIALGWLRKRGWASMDKTEGRLKITLTDLCIREVEGESWISSCLKEMLERDYPMSDLTEERFQMLKGRKAIDVREEKKRVLTLTPTGASVPEDSLILKEEVTQLTPEMLRNGAWRTLDIKRFDVSVPVRRVYFGKKQPYLAFLDELKSEFVALGFQEMRGPMIETEFWNFDALFQPQNHPARDWTDTYRLISPKKGTLPTSETVDRVRSSHETNWKYVWDDEKAKNLMPRAHGTCLSARQLYKGVSSPGKYFSIARCFRPDVLDKTHLIEFNQIEGIICDTSLTFRSLLGVLKLFATEIAGAEKVRFYPDYYPFTEPSVQMSAKHPDLGWVEFGGAGIFRKELTQPLGVDTPVIAWGLGVDRLAMFKLGIDDIRFLFSEDIKWLRDEVMV